MASSPTISLINSWETVRYELLNTRLCDLGLSIENSPVEPLVNRLYRELARKSLHFEPWVYLTDGWGCPDQVPIIGIPFYLTDKRLGRMEEEQTGELEDDQLTMMLLRHEAGHAYNYAYRLWEYPGWTETFGRFSKPYRDHFTPNPTSKEFVKHLVHHRYGRTYAQKHPDEDFAETFAVWLTPHSRWRQKYRYWPALRKLKFVDQLMRRIRRVDPIVTTGEPLEPVEELTLTLAEHYGQRAERYRAAAQGYVDDKLLAIFPPLKSRVRAPVHELVEKHLDDIRHRMARWSELDEEEVDAILHKLRDRAEFLGLEYRPKEKHEHLLDLVALATSLAMMYSSDGAR